jgi:hypothetical protein
MLIYPENWEEPAVASAVTLTAPQRVALKTKMKEYLNNKGVPIQLKELCDIAHDYVLDQVGKHIHDSVFKEVALEIQEEWYPTPEPEVVEPEPEEPEA